MPPVKKQKSCSEGVSNRRDAIREMWMRWLGPLPEQSALDVETHSVEELSDHTRILVSYATEPGARTEAYLLVPSSQCGVQTRYPAAVVFHATTEAHIRQPVGLASAATRHLGLALVRRGYVVLCPKCFIYGYRGRVWLEAVEALRTHCPGLSGMGKMVWDGMRAVDVLTVRPEVRTEAILAAGHSLGAKEALYLMAFDERVVAGLASEGGIPLAASNWDAPWYWGERIEVLQAACRDHDDLLELIAPRPFAIVGGGSADGIWTRQLVDRAELRCHEAGVGMRVKCFIHQAGHDFPKLVREEAFNWLENQLSLGRG